MSFPRRKRRVTLIAFLTIIVVLLTTGAVAWMRVPRDSVAKIEPGVLSIGEGAAQVVSAGDLEVTITTVPEARVEVSDGEGIVWSSVPGASFLGAARGHLEAEEDRGYFWIDTAHEQTWPKQTVERVETTGNAVVLTGTLSDGNAAGPDWQARFTQTERGVLLEAEIGSSEGATSLAFWSARAEDSAVHGFGEQFTDFNLDGRLLPIVAREQGVGRGEQPLTALADLTNNGAGGTEEMTYAAWPSWVTSDLRGVRLDPSLPESHAIAVADLEEPGQVGLEIHARKMGAELVSADSPLEVITKQHAGTERPELASWTGEGAIIGIQGGTEKVRETIRSLQEADTKIAGVWLQDWTGQRTTSFGERLWWTWQLDEERYPGWEDLVSDLDDDGITVTTYVNPFLVDPGEKEAAPQRSLFAEAEQAGYLVTDAAGQPYALDQGGFDAYLVDLTNEAARTWYAEVIATEVLAGGVRGFMADFAEGLPLDAKLADGDAQLLHNRWPGLWAQTVREACEIAEQPDCVRWFRAGSLGMEAHSPLFWRSEEHTSELQSRGHL